MVFQVARRRFTADEFRAMARAGILDPEERVELIEGEIVEMSPINEPHASATDRLTQLFVLLFHTGAIVRVHGPVGLDRHSQPQPDLMLLRPRQDFYRGSHPAPEDVLLIVEVSDTTLAYDRRVKAPLYSRIGIAEHWRVELGSDRIVVHRDPGPDGYRSVRIARRGESIAPLAFPDRALAVNDLLG